MKVGDIVTRVWGDGFMRTEMRVSAVDDTFIYCDAQRKLGERWQVLPAGYEPWKFDRVYGVETDETQGWGIEPHGRNLLLTRIELQA